MLSVNLNELFTRRTINKIVTRITHWFQDMLKLETKSCYHVRMYIFYPRLDSPESNEEQAISWSHYTVLVQTDKIVGCCLIDTQLYVQSFPPKASVLVFFSKIDLGTRVIVRGYRITASLKYRQWNDAWVGVGNSSIIMFRGKIFYSWATVHSPAVRSNWKQKRWW